MELQSKDELKIVRVLKKAESYTLGILKNRVRGFNEKSLDRLIAVGIVGVSKIGSAPNGKSADRYFLVDSNQDYSFKRITIDAIVDSHIPMPEDLVVEAVFAKIAYAMQVGDSYLDKAGSDDADDCESVIQIKKYGREYGYAFVARKVEGGIRIWRIS